MVLGNLFNSVKSIAGVGGATNNIGFRKKLVNADFGLTANVTCVAGQYTQIGEYTVPAQQLIAFGYGTPNEGNGANQGYVYVRIDDTSGAMAGTLRLVQSNAQGTKRIVVAEERTETFKASETDRTLAMPLPEQIQFPKVGEDSKLVIEFKPDGASDLTLDYDATETKYRIPVTIYQ